MQADLTRHAFEQLVSDEIPPALKAGRVQLVRITNGVSRIRSYSELDPLDVPAALMETLGYFDGRPTDEALKANRRRESHPFDSGPRKEIVRFPTARPRPGLAIR